jgi:hypothetical protein
MVLDKGRSNERVVLHFLFPWWSMSWALMTLDAARRKPCTVLTGKPVNTPSLGGEIVVA